MVTTCSSRLQAPKQVAAVSHVARALGARGENAASSWRQLVQLIDRVAQALVRNQGRRKCFLADVVVGQDVEDERLESVTDHAFEQLVVFQDQIATDQQLC